MRPSPAVLPGYLVVFSLAVLLASTTPIGTGTGIHQFDLLHPLFSHVHIVNGRVLTHEQVEQGQASVSWPASTRGVRGPAIGSGSGPLQADAGIGLSPTLPWPSPIGLLTDPPAAPFTIQMRPPVGQLEAPPDPPPTSAT